MVSIDYVQGFCEEYYSGGGGGGGKLPPPRKKKPWVHYTEIAYP